MSTNDSASNIDGHQHPNIEPAKDKNNNNNDNNSDMNAKDLNDNTENKSYSSSMYPHKHMAS